MSDAERIRLLLVTDTPVLGPGGSESFIRHLVSGLDAERFEIDIVQLSPPPRIEQPLRKMRGGQHIRLEYRPIGPIYGWRAFAVYRELRRRILCGSYRIVQSQHEKSDILCALLPRGRGGVMKISNRRDMGFQKSTLLRTGFRVINSRFDRVIAPSRAILEGLVHREAVRRERTHCLPNGVDTQRFHPWDERRRLEGRRAMGLDDSHYLFGCAARFVPVKRHEDLLRAFAQATVDCPQARLALVGSGPLEGELHQQAEALDIGARVLFCGDRADVENVLPLLDAFVLSSSTEGMSNAILEAMACGLPIVATAVGGNPEVVQPGRTGLLVPPLAPQELATALRALLDCPERGRWMGRHGRRRVEARFSLSAMINAFSRLYLEPACAA